MGAKRPNLSDAIPAPNPLVNRLLQAKCKTPEGFVYAEAQGIRQRNSELPGDAYHARLKSRITLPTVKGYWE